MFAALCGCGDQVVGTFDGVGVPASSGTVEPSDPDVDAGDTTSTPPSTTEDGASSEDDGDEIGPHPTICDDTKASETESDCGDCWRIDSPTHVYWVCSDELEWATANAMCGTIGATSAIVESAEEVEFLLAKIDYGFFWIGARRDGDHWRWVDGTAVEYTNWADHQPDDAEPGQDCVRMTWNIVDGEGWFHGAWDDFFCDFPQRVLCSRPQKR